MTVSPSVSSMAPFNPLRSWPKKRTSPRHVICFTRMESRLNRSSSGVLLARRLANALRTFPRLGHSLMFSPSGASLRTFSANRQFGQWLVSVHGHAAVRVRCPRASHRPAATLTPCALGVHDGLFLACSRFVHRPGQSERNVFESSAVSAYSGRVLAWHAHGHLPGGTSFNTTAFAPMLRRRRSSRHRGSFAPAPTLTRSPSRGASKGGRATCCRA